METKQKNRETGTEKTARPVKKRPAEAEVKTAKKPAPGKKAAPEKKAVPEKKTAPKKKAPVKKPRPEEAQEDISSKKRAYGNSKPKKRSALSLMAENTKQNIRKRRKKRTGTTKPQIAVPTVIYTEPKVFNSRRFLVQMVTVVAVVVACVLALSVFFKVDKITVTGADVYSDWSIEQASGIQKGDKLLTFSHARAGAQIKANLPYVNTVRFGIKLPDTVNIIVEEAEVVYSVKDGKGQWWLMNSDGRIVEMINEAAAANYTQVLGVELESPAPNLQAVAAEASPTETDASGEFIPVTVTGAQRLHTAMQILKALEANDIVGDAASVDVTRVEDIILWYGSRYQVNLGDSTRLEYKIAYMNDAILEELQDYQSGILDVSFTIRHNEAVFTPFG